MIRFFFLSKITVLTPLGLLNMYCTVPKVNCTFSQRLKNALQPNPVKKFNPSQIFSGAAQSKEVSACYKICIQTQNLLVFGLNIMSQFFNIKRLKKEEATLETSFTQQYKLILNSLLLFEYSLRFLMRSDFEAMLDV